MPTVAVATVDAFDDEIGACNPDDHRSFQVEIPFLVLGAVELAAGVHRSVA